MPQVPLSEDGENPGSLSAQGILDALNSADEEEEVSPEDKVDLEDDKDDDEPKDKDEKDEKDDDDKDEDDKDDEEDEELEIKDEDTEDEDEEGPSEEDEVFAAPPRKRDILKKYPKVFKEFPYLEVALYRDQKFVEIFPTVQDAKDAAEKGEYLENFEDELLSGKTQNLLKVIKETDENAFANIVDNYVEVLGEIDPAAQVHVISGVAKKIIISLARDGKQQKSDELQETARRLHAYLFGGGEFQPHQKLGKEIEEEGESEHDEWLEERFNVVNDDLTTRIENSLRATIDSNIDPKESMTEYVRTQAARDVLQQMQKAIGDDRRFTGIIDELWRKSADDNFSIESQRKIRSAYLSKAKTVLPGVLKRVRHAALKGLGKKSTEGRKKSSEKERGRTAPVNRSGKKRSEDGRGMSTYEFLSQD